ncbi:MAG: lytic murein transglycosylase [Paracoccaceae bacterium]
MRFSAILTIAALTASPAIATVPCGGTFNEFIAAMKSEALARGHGDAIVNRFFASAAQDAKVLAADRAQGIFRTDFIDFSRRVISQNRMDNGRRYSDELDGVFDRIKRDYGVSRGVLLALWALETDFGQVQGEFNTLNALLTLSQDCRRPELFQPQIFAALELFDRGDFDPATTKGAWAGEIGMVQMLPGDILTNGVDGDGDGRVSLKTSKPDALMSGARMLQSLGWRANEPWISQITVPGDLDWRDTGLRTTKTVSEWAALGVTPRNGDLGAPDMPASVILPMGHEGPAFLVYPNFSVFFEWNQSFTYVMSAAYFATRLEGAAIFDPGSPSPLLSDAEMKALQAKLELLGYDVGGVDGILGAKTRAAIQAEQIRLGLPADAWPTPELLNRL